MFVLATGGGGDAMLRVHVCLFVSLGLLLLLVFMGTGLIHFMISNTYDYYYTCATSKIHI